MKQTDALTIARGTAGIELMVSAGRSAVEELKIAIETTQNDRSMWTQK